MCYQLADGNKTKLIGVIDMGLFDVLRGELIDIIEWIDDSNRTLVWRFPRHQRLQLWI